MSYKITSITHLDGTPRMDGRYPLRVGRVCSFLYEPATDQCMYLNWIRNSDGSAYSGYLRTSLVKQIERHADGTLIITTCNSVYTFVPSFSAESMLDRNNEICSFYYHK